MTGKIRPELLSPAGDMEKLKYAIAYGADAVYLSGKAFGMRTASGNFDNSALEDAVALCHEKGVKIYVTVNIMPRQDDLLQLPQYLEHLNAIGVDAIIAADLGVISLIKKHAPAPQLHISTQANVTNHMAAQSYYDMGASRIVLARELSIEEIASIRAKGPRGLELEVFVHGSMCMSYSGRCMLSNYLTGRDANRGACAQPCRWNYAVVEEKRPMEYMPVFEDEGGTHIFNSKDMCTIEHLPQLIDAGIDSFKIEGRVKTFYYASVITNAYRRAIDFYLENKGAALPPGIGSEVFKVSHRQYYTGFFFGDNQNIQSQDSEYIRTWDVCAVVEECDNANVAVCMQKNKFSKGETLELLMPGQDALPFLLTRMWDETGKEIDTAPHPHMKVKIALPQKAPPMAILRRESNT